MGSSCIDSSHVLLPERPLTSSSIDRNRYRRLVFLSPSSRKKNTGIVCCSVNGNASSSKWCSTSPPLFSDRLDVPVEEDQVVFSPEKATHKDVETMNSTSCKEAEARSVAARNGEEGVGIVRFLGGKNFLITGATGFLAKVLIEKILRTNPSVGKIYILIKAKDKEAAMKRLKTEIVNTELFRCLQEIHGKNYQSFMLRKLIPVVGDVRVGNIGINPEIAEEISEEVDVIINSAANTTFDERYDVALDINTIGPFRLMSFAKRFKRLKLFLQVSTAYVNGQRQGRILEKPFRIGDTITKETNLSKSAAKHTPMLDIEAEIKLAFDSRRNSSDASAVQEMKDLGLKRAKINGWQDTYVFTKAMGEMVINCMRGDIPVITMRPSVIESTWKEPFPGWMEGNRMMDPIVLYYGKGQLTGFLADPDGVLDVVPADMVVNATLAAMAKHGSCGEPGMHVYHVASSIVNPLVFQDLARILFEHFSTNPCVDMRGRPILVPPMKLFSDMSKFSTYVSADAVQKSSKAAEVVGASTQEKLLQRLKNICTKSVEQAVYLANIYEPYTFYGGRFDNTNMENLMDEMSEDEKRSFPFDVRSIDWKEYISKVHIPGLRKHVMKGRGMCSRPQLVNSSM